MHGLLSSLTGVKPICGHCFPKAVATVIYYCVLRVRFYSIQLWNVS